MKKSKDLLDIDNSTYVNLNDNSGAKIVENSNNDEFASPENIFDNLSPENMNDNKSPEIEANNLSPEELFNNLSPEDVFDNLSPETDNTISNQEVLTNDNIDDTKERKPSLLEQFYATHEIVSPMVNPIKGVGLWAEKFVNKLTDKFQGEEGDAKTKFENTPWYENLARISGAGFIYDSKAAYNKLMAEAAKPINKNLSTTLEKKANYYREQSELSREGAHGWQSDVGNAIPSATKLAGVVIGSALAPPLSPALSNVYLADMGMTTAGNSLIDYDEYKKSKGEDPTEGGNAYARWGVALGNAASEVLTERLLGGITRYIPKPLKKTLGQDVLGKLFRTKAGEKAFGNAVKTFAKQNPTLWRKIAQKGVENIQLMTGEAFEEATNQITQLAIENLYKEAEDAPELQDWLSQTFDAAKGGAIMSLMVSPVRGSAISRMRHQRRQEKGMSVVVTNDGEAVELIGVKDNKLIGETPSGIQVEIKPEDVVDQAYIHPKEYEDYLEGLEQGLDQSAFEYASSFRFNQTGDVHMYYKKDQDKATEKPVYLVGVQDKMAVVVNPNDGNKREIVAFDDLEDEGAIVKFDDFLSYIKESQSETIDKATAETDRVVEEQLGIAKQFTPGQHVEYNGEIGIVTDIGPDGELIVDTQTGTVSVPVEEQNKINKAAIIDVDGLIIEAIETENGLEVQAPLPNENAANDLASKLNELYAGKKIFEVERISVPDENQPDQYKVVGRNPVQENETINETQEIQTDQQNNDLQPGQIQSGQIQTEQTETPEQLQAEAVQPRQIAEPVQQRSITDGENNYNVKDNKDGSYQIGEQTTDLQSLEQLRDKLQKMYEGKLTFEVQPLPSIDLFTPNEYVLIAKPAQNVDIQNTVNQNLQSELQSTEQQNNENVQYSVDGQPISRGMAKMLIKKAKTKEDLNGLNIVNDEELANMISDKFPEPEYLFEGDPMTREEVIAAIENAESVDDLEGLVVNNDPEIESLIESKFNNNSETSKEGTLLSQNVGKNIKFEGHKGILRQSPDGVYVMDIGDKEYIVSNTDKSIADAGVEVLTKDRTFEIQDENTILVDGKPYTIEADDNGSITGLIDERGNRIKNERWLINAEIERSKLEHPEPQKTLNELGVTDDQISEVEIILNRNFNDNIGNLLDNGVDENTTEKEFIAAKIWAEDVINNLEKLDSDYSRATAESIYEFLNILENEYNERFGTETTDNAESESTGETGTIAESTIPVSSENTTEVSNEVNPNESQSEGTTEQLNKPKGLYSVVSDLENRTENKRIDEEANKTDISPSKAQIESGNYRKGHINIHGLNISIENPKGSERSGVDKNGKKWSVKLNNHYGYIRGTDGNDGDQVDVFIGDKPKSKKVYIIDQIDPETGVFDEHKVMIGFESENEAADAYFANYEEGWLGFGNITEITIDDFKDWLKNGDKTEPFNYEEPKSDEELAREYLSNISYKERRKRVLSREPESLEEHILQFFVGGGRISSKDFLDFTGFKPGSKEFQSFLWAIKKDGQKLDLFDHTFGITRGQSDAITGESTYADNTFGKETFGAMDLANEVIETLLTYGTPSRMVEALEDLQLMDTVDFINSTATENLNNKENNAKFEDIFAQFSDAEGNIDYEKLWVKIEDDPGFFTVFPFGLTENEFEQLKQTANERRNSKGREKSTVSETINPTESGSSKSESIQSSEGDGFRVSETTEQTEKENTFEIEGSDESESSATVKDELGNSIFDFVEYPQVAERWEDRPMSEGQRNRIKNRIQREVVDKENELIRKLNEARNKLQNLKDKIDNRVNVQASLGFENNENPTITESELFNVPLDASKENITKQLQGAQNEVNILQRELKDFHSKKDFVINRMVDLELSQQEIFDEIFGKVDLDKVLNKIKNSKITRVEGLGMGQNQARGVYLSTEEVNRYADEEHPAIPYGVNIKNPAVFDQHQNQFFRLQQKVLYENLDKLNELDFELLEKVEHPTVDDLSYAGIQKLGGFVTDYLQSLGYDSIYFTGEGENELVVFDENKVWRKTEHVSQIEDAAKEVSNDLGVNIEVVEKPENTDEDVMFSKTDKGIIQGYYDGKNDRIVVVASNISDPETARKVVLHEVLGHKGLRKVLGEQYEKVLKGVYKSIPETDLANLKSIYGDDPLVIAEEYIASMAENYKRPNLLHRIAGRVKNMIRKLFNVEYSTNDILYLLSRSEDAIKKSSEVKYTSFNINNEGNTPLSQGENPADRNHFVIYGIKDSETGNVSPADINYIGKKGNVRENIQDFMVSVKALQKEVLRRGGKIRWFEDAYNQENLSYGRIRYQLENVNKDYVQPLVDAMYKVAGDTSKKEIDKLQRYLKAKHAPERNRKISKDKGLSTIENQSGFTNEEAQAIVEEYENTHDIDAINELWDKIRALSRFTLNKLKESGKISEDLYYELTEGDDAYQYYVPLQGFNNDEIQNRWEYVSEGSEFATTYKKAKGRKSESGNPIEYLVNMAQGAIVLGERNKIAQAMYRMIKNNPNPDLYHIKKTYYIKTGVKGADGKEEIVPVYERPSEEMFEKGMVVEKINPKKYSLTKRIDDQHSLEVWVNGQRIVLRFENPEVPNAIKRKKLKQPFNFLKISDATRWLTQNFTAKNPAFIMPNTLRDVGYAWLAHAVKGEKGDATKFFKNLKTAHKAMRNYFKIIKLEENINQTTDKKEKQKLQKQLNRYKNDKIKLGNKEYSLYQLYNQFKANGAETGFVFSKNIDMIAEELRSELNKAKNRAGNKMFFNKKGEIRLYKKSGELLEGFAEWSENLSRLSTFITELENGKDQFNAAVEAKNITVNFNRRGNYSPLVGSFYAFFNATIQGAENGLRLAYKHKGKFAKAAATMYSMGFLVSLLSHLAPFSDDEDKDWYGNINPYIKHNYLVIGTNGNNYISLPLPQFWRAFYGAGVSTFENLFVNRYKDEKVKWKGEDAKFDQLSIDYLNLAFNAFSPIDPTQILSKDDVNLVTIAKPFAPTITTGVLDVIENRDFADRPVVREPYTKGLEKQMANAGLYKRNVNYIAKEITDWLYQRGGGDIETYAKMPLKNRIIQERVPWYMDINPSAVEYLVSYYAGGRGRFFNNLIKTSVSLVEGTSNLMQGKEAPFANFDANSVPILRRFYRQSYDYQTYEDYNSLKEQVEAYEYNMNNFSLRSKALNFSPEYIVLKAQIDIIEKQRELFRQFKQSPQVLVNPKKLKEINDKEYKLIKDFVKEQYK